MSKTAIGTMQRPTVYVCLFFGAEGDTWYEYRAYSSPHIARVIAESIADGAREGDRSPAFRSVSLQREDGTWETIYSIYEVRKLASVS